MRGENENVGGKNENVGGEKKKEKIQRAVREGGYRGEKNGEEGRRRR